MARLIGEMKVMFEKQLAVIATASKDGTPNVGPKGSMHVLDDETLGLPPKKESSIDVRLELKIKGVNHGQEIAFSGADYQDDVVTTSESSTGMVPVISTFESSTQILIFSISSARRFISKSKLVSFSRTS